jgi:N-acylneuraminate cytidylyltransferase/CMP-N,N'-diacetyllegionaminic acid synthase
MTESGKQRVLALIPARGGSKGLPGKNLRKLCGRPLIEWSIDFALSCNEIDAVVVSTEDEIIAKVARLAGAEVPFLRPLALAEDSSSTIEVVLHALEILEKQSRIFDIILLLEPTSPLREVSDIRNALQRMKHLKASSIVSVVRCETVHPAFMFSATETGRLVPFLAASPTGLRRQDVQPLFSLEGSLYISTVETFRKQRSFYHKETIYYEVEKWKSFEIDDMVDFQIIEAIAKYRQLSWQTSKPD